MRLVKDASHSSAVCNVMVFYPIHSPISAFVHVSTICYHLPMFAFSVPLFLPGGIFSPPISFSSSHIFFSSSYFCLSISFRALSLTLSFASRVRISVLQMTPHIFLFLSSVVSVSFLFSVNLSCSSSYFILISFNSSFLHFTLFHTSAF